MDHQPLTRRAASEAVGDRGWRFVLGALRTSIPAGSMAEAAGIAARAVAACGPDADDQLRAELRPGRVVLTLRSRAGGGVTTGTVELAHRIAAAVPPGRPESVQQLEIAVDALDIAAVRPFWRAVLAYADGPGDLLVDPNGTTPVVWFQQMDAPRPQRNRLHLDISVPHDEAPGRLEAALAAGGRIVSDEHVPAWWVLADPEGNEVCLTTWQGRD
ncbi:VOC family protein [Actinoplanes sp. CA-030573]|uniref:VOC family protein n=1 Tax=Actinoplanes sp. CA-030573 TaxID=3239898 RepID=UPI003D8A9353